MRRLALEWTVGKPFGRAPTACGQGGQGEMGEQNRGGVYEGGWKGGTGGAFQYDDDSTLNSSSAFLVPLALEILPDYQGYNITQTNLLR